MTFSFPPLRRLLPFRKLPLLPGLALVGALVVLAGCHPRVSDPKDPKFIVAEKDNWQITRSELDQEIGAFMKQNHLTPEMLGPAKAPLLETAMLKNMVLQKILLEKGSKLDLKDVDKDANATFDRIKGHFPNDAAFQAKLTEGGMTQEQLKKRIHDQIVVTKVLQAEALKNVDPTDAEINDFYTKNRERYFNQPAKVRASRVLKMVDEHTSPKDKAAKKKEIDQAHDRVVKGEDFGKVATQVSDDRASAPKGGDLAPFQKGENEAGFDDVAFSTKVGQVSPVFQTQLGYQFIKVTDSQPAGVVPLAEARPAIVNFLGTSKKHDQEDAYTNELLKSSGVKYHIALAETPIPGGPDEPHAPGAAAGGTPPPNPPPAPTSSATPPVAAPGTPVPPPPAGH